MSLLKGVRVLDLSQYIPGPFATRQLADYGADVIKIEPPAGDPMRHLFSHGESLSPVYQHLNAGKRVLRLDLKQPDDCDRFNVLLARADVLLESYRPGVLARLGFTAETLKALNPRLIHCALSGYGQNGPYAQTAGHDINYCAAAGGLSLNGLSERPLMIFPPPADHAGAQQACTAILAALFARERDQRGRFLDVSLYEASLAWQYLGQLAAPEGRESHALNGGAAYYNLYRTADDEFLSLGAIEAKFWAAFCEVIGQPDWFERQHEAVPQTELINNVAAIIAGQTRAYWLSRFDAVDCCMEPLNSPQTLTEHPQTAFRHPQQTTIAAAPLWLNQQPNAPLPALQELSDVAASGWL